MNPKTTSLPALLCASLLCATPAFAAGWATFSVDDSMSQVQAGAAQLRWRHALPSRNASNVLDATMDVRIVLNTSPWVGKPARIYMVMPALAQSSLSVQWTTSGLLQPGRLSSGQRQLVFSGGTFNGGSVSLASIARNTFVENCFTYSYANSAVLPAGTYTGRAVFTLAVP